MNVYLACLVAQFFQIKDVCAAKRLNKAWRNDFTHPTIWNYIFCDVVADDAVRAIRSFPHAKCLHLTFLLESPTELPSSVRELNLQVAGSSVARCGIRSYLENPSTNSTLRRFETDYHVGSVAVPMRKFPQLTALYLHGWNTELSDLHNVTSFGYCTEERTALISGHLLQHITSLHLFEFTCYLVCVQQYFSAFQALRSLNVPIANLAHLREVQNGAQNVEILTVRFQQADPQSEYVASRMATLAAFGTRLKQLVITFKIDPESASLGRTFTLSRLRALTCLQRLEIQGVVVDETDIVELQQDLSLFKMLQDFRCVNCVVYLPTDFRFPIAMGNLRYIQLAHLSKVFY